MLRKAARLVLKVVTSRHPLRAYVFLSTRSEKIAHLNHRPLPLWDVHSFAAGVHVKQGR